MSVYKAINAVQSALSKTGIAKDNHNQQQGYKFRGIDDCYNALSPLLAEHGLCILPRVLARTVEQHQTQKGGTLFYVTVEVEFDVVCVDDGSSHIIKTFGEAMDSGDKATNKAMSAAYKYAAFQMFAIPTEGDNDADGHTHEIASRQSHASMPANVLADWLVYIDDSASVGDLKKRAAEAEQNAASDPVALAKIRAAVATKAAKAKPTKEMT